MSVEFFDEFAVTLNMDRCKSRVSLNNYEINMYIYLLI